MKLAAMMAPMLLTWSVHAHVMPYENFETKPVLADLKDLRALNIPTVSENEFVEVGYAIINPEMQHRLQERAHKVGKCGGFEDLTMEQGFLEDSVGMLDQLAALKKKEQQYSQVPFRLLGLQKNPKIEEALNEVMEGNLQNYVTWLSSFPNRYNKAPEPNRHVFEMKLRLEAMLSSVSIPYEVSLIDHTSTRQKSIRVRLPGSQRPQEILVLGGHLDSINGSWGGGDIAPGADDNASGSANLIEALRILTQQGQPERTVEFFWYAGEESGLLGSAEIAKQYKAENKDVIAVLQLDMTLFPGSGEFVMASMTDFTSAWLRDYIKEINSLYLNIQIIEDKCGYGCSDHASWHRQGYPAVMPSESTMRAMNRNIHTSKDVIGPLSNFRHSAVYAKLALALAMDLGNSSARQPY